MKCQHCDGRGRWLVPHWIRVDWRRRVPAGDALTTCAYCRGTGLSDGTQRADRPATPTPAGKETNG